KCPSKPRRHEEKWVQQSLSRKVGLGQPAQGAGAPFRSHAGFEDQHALERRAAQPRRARGRQSSPHAEMPVKRLRLAVQSEQNTGVHERVVFGCSEQTVASCCRFYERPREKPSRSTEAQARSPSTGISCSPLLALRAQARIEEARGRVAGGHPRL